MTSSSLYTYTPANTNQPKTKHDVFLSFEKEDTRSKNFAAYLHSTLTRSGIDAYKNTSGFTYRVRTGHPPDTKISDCRVSVVILSPCYANSEYCMDELVKIVKCMKTKGQIVLPVFLGVDPTHVRKQIGAFADGFRWPLLSESVKSDMGDARRKALVEITNLAGWVSRNEPTHRIVEDIVSTVETILSQNNVEDGFVGSGRIHKVESLLCLGSNEGVHSVGIFGTSGIGKTTIARNVFYRNSDSFDSASFIENVAEKSKREGLDPLQKDMMSQLLGPDNSKANIHTFSFLIKRNLIRGKRVLIVLDDVATPGQLRTLLGRYDNYGSGSRIIVTSTEIQVLKSGCIDVYEVEKLNDHEALQLFTYHAFKQGQPTGKFIELSEKAVAYSEGLPSAIENLGCNLYGKSIEEWEAEVAKLEESLDLELPTYDGFDIFSPCCVLRG